jgi:putative inorganic carbon (hco3(-)) transporter
LKLPVDQAKQVALAAGPESETRWHYNWLLVSIFMEYARPASFIPIFRIPFLISAIPLTLLLVVLFSKKVRPIREIMTDSTAKWMVAYIAMITLSVTYAMVTEYAFNAFKLTVGYLGFFILLSSLVTTERRLYGVVVTLLVAHLFLLAMNPNVILDPESRNYVIGATFLGDGNDFSLSLCALLPCVLMVSIRSKHFMARLTLWAGALILLFAIVASQSRGATIGLAAVFGYLWLFSPNKGVTLAVIAAVVAVMLLYAPDAYFKRMNSITDYQNEGSAMGRIDAWKSSMRMAADSPLLGVGAGNFPVAYGTKYLPKGAPPAWKTAHSSYFLVLGELGVTGLVLLLGLVVSNFKGNSKVRKKLAPANVPSDDANVRSAIIRLRLLNAALIGFAVAGAFLSAAYYPHIFVLSGLMVAARLNITRDQGAASDSGDALRI